MPEPGFKMAIYTAAVSNADSAMYMAAGCQCKMAMSR